MRGNLRKLECICFAPVAFFCYAGDAYMITYDQFRQTELRVARVESAERVEGSEKLLKLRVSVGQEERQIIAGIGKAYEPEALIGKNIVIVANLEPRKLMGLESQGMLLAASDDAQGLGPVLLTTLADIPPGSEIR